jgi:hypothetical protein
LDIVPAESVGIHAVIDADWDGTPRILITEGESEPEESQLGVIGQTTLLTIFVLCADKDTAIDLCRIAANAVYTHIEAMERQDETGILAITRNASKYGNIADRTEFEAFRSFHVIHTLNT